MKIIAAEESIVIEEENEKVRSSSINDMFSTCLLCRFNLKNLWVPFFVLCALQLLLYGTEFTCFSAPHVAP